MGRIKKAIQHGKRMVAAAVSTALILAHLPISAPVMAAEPLNRPEDPVIVSGADVTLMANVLASNLVGFRYTSAGWEQVPIQVDERKTVSYGTDVYNGKIGGYVTENYAKFSNLVYCDVSTHVGADVNPCFDADDELVFMARDTGIQMPEGTTWPTGVKPIRCAQLTVTDPLFANAVGYLYLFEKATDSALTNDAGKSYVDYQFKLVSGKTYKEEYPFTKANNTDPIGRPEDSSITTANYTYHFEDRWADDGLTIKAGGATGVDILDRNKVAIMPSSEVPSLASMFYDGDLSGGRTEDTFDGMSTDKAEGAFICNINGPIRAIRAFIGANSGPLTQRNYYAYDSRMDIVTNLRVHAMPSLMSFFDYSVEAIGMKYYRDDATGGVTIDGNGKSELSTSAAMSETELVSGAQGSLAMTTMVETNVENPPFSLKAYYLDDASASPKDTQHTGDAYAYGSSGFWVCGNISSMIGELLGSSLEQAAQKYGIPNTDPVRSASAKTLTVTKNLRFRAPGMTFAEAQAATQLNKTPLSAVASTVTNPDIGDVELWTAVYKANGAQSGSVPVDYEEYYVDGTLTLPGNLGGLTRRGYKFIGWGASPDATTPLTYYTATAAGTVTFYALWEKTAAYTQAGTDFIDGAPSALFEENFAYADNTTASNLVSSGKWSTKAEATSDGAFSKTYNGAMVFNGRLSSSSSPRLGVNIDPSLVSGKNTVTVTYKVRTGSIGKSQFSLYAGSSNVSGALVTLEKGKIIAKGTSNSLTYTTSAGTYTALDGEWVDMKLILNFKDKTFSAYANDQLLASASSMSGIGDNTDLILTLNGSYGSSASGYNWAAFDDLVLRQAAIAAEETQFFINDAPMGEKLTNGTLKISRTVYNELPVAFSAIMIVGVYDKDGRLTQTRFLPFNLGAMGMGKGECELTITDKDHSVQILVWRGLLNMQQILTPQAYSK